MFVNDPNVNSALATLGTPTAKSRRTSALGVAADSSPSNSTAFHIAIASLIAATLSCSPTAGDTGNRAEPTRQAHQHAKTAIACPSESAREADRLGSNFQRPFAESPTPSLSRERPTATAAEEPHQAT